MKDGFNFNHLEKVGERVHSTKTKVGIAVFEKLKKSARKLGHHDMVS